MDLNLLKKILIPIPLLPHPLAYVRVYHGYMGTVLSLDFILGMFSRILDVLCMGSCHGVYKVVGVVHLNMGKPHGRDAPICGPSFGTSHRKTE